MPVHLFVFCLFILAAAVVFACLLQKSIYGDKAVLRLKGPGKEARYKLPALHKGKYSRLGHLEGPALTGGFLLTQGWQFDMYDEYEHAVIALTQQ